MSEAARLIQDAIAIHKEGFRLGYEAAREQAASACLENAKKCRAAVHTSPERQWSKWFEKADAHEQDALEINAMTPHAMTHNDRSPGDVDKEEIIGQEILSVIIHQKLVTSDSVVPNVLVWHRNSAKIIGKAIQDALSPQG